MISTTPRVAPEKTVTPPVLASVVVEALEKPMNFNPEDVVVPSVREIAVYENMDGEVVICQSGNVGDEDAFVIVPVIFLPALIEALEAKRDAAAE